MARSITPRGVTPGVRAAAGVEPGRGVALTTLAGVSSHLGCCLLGVGVAIPVSFKVASQVIPAGVAASGVTSESAIQSGVGGSSQWFLRPMEGVTSPTLPGVGVASHLPIPGVESDKSQSEPVFTFLAAAPSSSCA